MNLEKAYHDRFGEFPLSNITWYLLGGQIVAFLFTGFYPGLRDAMLLQADQVFAGQWWRLFTFLYVPPPASPIWTALGWYFIYILGTGLELTWGSFRYALYLVIACVATIVGALLFPQQPFAQGYVFTSLFLAFAYLNPNFTLLLFFIIPVKIKWLAYLAWFGIGWNILWGSMATKTHSLLTIANFVLFFGRELLLTFQSSARRGSVAVSGGVTQPKTYMRCSVCTATENDGKIFYFCHECLPETSYCEDHITAHVHKKNGRAVH